ncbi:MAG TPA: hypothetical protein EYP34_10215 [Chromatiaceae bacterium]|nr:hypothetical protein [Chromatiaceae bacterium]
MMNRLFGTGLTAALLLPAVSVFAGEAFMGQSPQVLCGYMVDLGIPGSKKYREQRGGSWACGSTRKKLPQGEPAAASDLQYRVLGSETGAHKQILELRMGSYRQPQGVLKAFSDYVDKLLEKTLGCDLSEDMYKAIMAPRDGEWQIDGHRAKLRKLHSMGAVYDLRFTLDYKSIRY